MIVIKEPAREHVRPPVGEPAKRRAIVARLTNLIRKAFLQRNVQADVESMFWDRRAAFDLALAAIGQREWALAERELTNGNGHRAVSDAHCLNLLGVVYESTGRWGLARQCYSRAIRRDRHVQAPQNNLRRYYELTTFGRTSIAVCLGDEKDVLL